MRAVARSILRDAIARSITSPSVDGGSVFSPASLFASGEQGFIISPADLSTLWQGPGRTNQVTAVGQSVVVADDLSGNGNNFTFTAATLQQDSDGMYYIQCNGTTTIGATGAINFTGTDKITALIGVKKDVTATAFILELSANSTANDGAFCIYTTPDGYVSFLRGTANAAVSVNSIFNNASKYVFGAQYDLAGALVGDEIKLSANGVGLVALASTPGPAGSGNFGNFAVYLGARSGLSLPFTGRIYPTIVRGAATTRAAMGDGFDWINERTLAYTKTLDSGYAIGDSTVAAYIGQNAVTDYVATSLTKRDVAVPGHTIAQQREVWEADTSRATAKWVVIQVGLNDLAPAEAASVAIARLQALVESVRFLSHADAKIVISQMVPCRARLITVYGGVDGPIAYQKWLDMNEAIAGSGPTPITGVDGRVTAHAALLNDGSGNLAAAYDTGDGIHTNNAGRDINGQAWEDALTALGVL